MSFFKRDTVHAAPTYPAHVGVPALHEDVVKQTAPGLVPLYKQAGVSLEKKGLSGQRAAVYLVLDRSGSMTSYYRDGSVQHLAEQALGLSANLDDDGIVPVVYFDHQVFGPFAVALTTYEGRIERQNQELGRMGGTSYAPAMAAVINHYKQSGATAPAFVIFQTDGDPQDQAATEQMLKDASNLPIFWAFVGFGSQVRFLKKLDRLRGRVVDNAGFFATNPKGMSDSDLYDALMSEYPQWLTAARQAGILR